MIVNDPVLRNTILNPEYYVFVCVCVCVFVDGCLSHCRLQVNSDCNDSDDDSLSLALSSLCFLSASHIIFSS